MPGDVVTFAGSGARRIERIEGANVWVQGERLDPARDGYPHRILIAVNDQRRAEWRLALLDHAFRLAQLDFLPNSWGASLAALSGQISPVGPLLDSPADAHSLRREADGSYAVLGPDPYLVFDISARRLSGLAAGLLQFRFACIGKQAEARVEVYYSADGKPFGEDRVVRASARDGSLLVPLDAQPRWLLAGHLQSLRIDLADNKSCVRVRIDNVRLWSRRGS
jgi:hypothetical protein